MDEQQQQDEQQLGNQNQQPAEVGTQKEASEQVQGAEIDGGAADEKGPEAAPPAAPADDQDAHPVHGILDRIEETIKGASEAVHREVAHLFEEAHALVGNTEELVD